MRRPLSVVGTDQEALKALLSLHAPPEPRILDVTANRGRMWKGLAYRPHRLDRDPALFESGYTDTVADFRALPFGPGEFDVIVFDPPHLTHAGGNGVMGEWNDRFGLDQTYFTRQAPPTLFRPFLAEAKRVLEPRFGVVLAKIADQVHGDRYRFQHVDLINTARELGFTPCDLMLTVTWSRGHLNDPRWRHVCHARQVHCYWLCLRNGSECVSRTAPETDARPGTEAMFA